MGTVTKFRQILVISLVALSTGCSSVYFVRNPKVRTFSDPVYQATKPYFFWSLVGPEYSLEVDKICLGKDADQVSTSYTPKDVLAAVVTLGIYTPRTMNIWCQL